MYRYESRGVSIGWVSLEDACRMWEDGQRRGEGGWVVDAAGVLVCGQTPQVSGEGM